MLLPLKNSYKKKLYKNLLQSLKRLLDMLTPISIICDPQHKPQKALCFLSLLQKNICISRQSQKQTKGDQGMRGNGWHSNRRVAGFRYQWLGQFIMLKTYICFIYISFVNTSIFLRGLIPVFDDFTYGSQVIHIKQIFIFFKNQNKKTAPLPHRNPLGKVLSWTILQQQETCS